jgi:hypothetical protein
MAKENDIILIYIEDQPLSFARIEEILADSKPDWYHVRLLLLNVPLQVVTWILKDVYINGEEFTMNAKRMRLEKVEAPKEDTLAAESDTDGRIEKGPREGKIISFKDLKKK